MPNHYHFLVKIKTKIEIDVYFSKPDLLLNLSPKEMNKKIAHQFGNLQNAYAKAFNKAFSRRGSLFLHTVNRRLIVDKDYLKNTFHYIHNNPVRHKFVSKIEDWKFSSYHAYLENKLSEIQKKFGLKHFGSIDNLLNYHDGKFDPNFMIDMEYEY